MDHGTTTPPPPGWWRHAAVYQVYIRSFADADGDGIGDIEGLRRRLPYLADLGVDAIWITPWFPSPMADGGYDVADYRDVDPLFGTLADADALVRDAHLVGIRILLDLVPNHTSDRHPWFIQALASPPGSSARARYVFADGRGPGGDLPPNNWPSVFGGPAWQRVPGPDGRPGQWFLHVFAPEQPDLDWSNREVRAEFESILSYWFDRGIDGFRIDVAHGLVKADGLPDLPDPGEDSPGGAGAPTAQEGDHPHWDRPEVHEIHRSWRRVAERFGGERVLIGEIGVESPDRLVEYLRDGQLHGAFNFPFMRAPWDATALRSTIDETIEMHRRVGAAPSWVLDNHDATRVVTRLGRPYSGIRDRVVDEIQPSDLAIGMRRARAAALLSLSLPGAAYVYQGDELGLPEVEDLPEGSLQDPIWIRSGRTVRGRDGCRVPLPWSGVASPFGFGPPGSVPWLPQPRDWHSCTAEAQAVDPGSMLTLYRAALRLRRSHPGLLSERFHWLPSPANTLRFARGARLECMVNLSPEPVALPTGCRVLLTSLAPDGTALPPDAAAWYEVDA